MKKVNLNMNNYSSSYLYFIRCFYFNIFEDFEDFIKKLRTLEYNIIYVNITSTFPSWIVMTFSTMIQHLEVNGFLASSSPSILE